MGFIRVAQNETYGDIYIDALKPIDTDVLSRVEEYDNVTAEKVAQDLTGTETNAGAAEDFVLPDEVDDEGREDQEAELVDAATDEEILAAEAELLGVENPGPNAEAVPQEQGEVRVVEIAQDQPTEASHDPEQQLSPREDALLSTDQRPPPPTEDVGNGELNG
jgi:hypothetical protein